jgi:hypothetical protein
MAANANGASTATERAARKPLVAAGAAAAGGAAIGAAAARLRAHKRRRRVLGVPLPHAREVRKVAAGTERVGQRLLELQADVRAVREQAREQRRQSPIEVLLSGLTSRRLPRHG